MIDLHKESGGAVPRIISIVDTPSWTKARVGVLLEGHSAVEQHFGRLLLLNGVEADVPVREFFSLTPELVGTTLFELQDWYSQECDGAWEHQYGISVLTLDNPGWRVHIELTGTSLQGVSFEPVRDLEHPRLWFSAEVSACQFRGACGPDLLPALLAIFLRWTHRVGSGPVVASPVE